SVVRPNAIQSIFRYNGGRLAETGAAGFEGGGEPGLEALLAGAAGFAGAEDFVGPGCLGLVGFGFPLLMTQCSNLFVCQTSKEPTLEEELPGFGHLKIDAVSALCCTESELRYAT